MKRPGRAGGALRETNMLNAVRNVASTVRWRLKPLRWAGKGFYQLRHFAQGRRGYGDTPADSAGRELFQQMEQLGFAKLDRKLAVADIDLAPLAGAAGGKSFVDILDRYPEETAAAFAQVVNDPEIGSFIMRYFGGNPWLWNVALNYSDVSKGLTDSQLWHFDYGDVRQLHALVYFSDVGERAGPFTFIEKPLSTKVPRHPLLIERLNDSDLTPHGLDAERDRTRLCGQRGDVFFNDPGVLLHQGARCETPRLVLFISFTTPAPMSRGGRSTISSSARKFLVKRRGENRQGGLPDEVLF